MFGFGRQLGCPAVLVSPARPVVVEACESLLSVGGLGENEFRSIPKGISGKG